MRTLVMSVMSLTEIMASRAGGWVRTRAASVMSVVRSVALRAGGWARTSHASMVNGVHSASSRAEARVRAVAASIGIVARSTASGSHGRAQAGAASVASVFRVGASHAGRSFQALVASLTHLGRAAASHTEGERVQIYLAFTLTFVLAMIVGTLMLSPLGARTHRAPPQLAGEPTPGPEAVAPDVDRLSASPSVTLPPSVALPHSTVPSRRTEDEARLLNVAPAAQPQVAAVAVRATGSVRGGVAKVTDIALWGNPSKPWVSITASAPVTYRLRNVEPDWVVIDVSKAELALSSGKPPAGRGLVRLIRVGQFTPDTVRVVLELTEAVPIHVATSPGKNAIVVSLAVDARGNSHTSPAPDRRPGAARVFPAARSGSPVPGT